MDNRRFGDLTSVLAGNFGYVFNLVSKIFDCNHYVEVVGAVEREDPLVMRTS